VESAGEIARPLVLLVEDDPDHAELIARSLDDAPVELATCGDLASARHLLAEREFALVLCDVRLPDGSGLDLLVDGGAGVPVVVMTSHVDDHQIAAALAAGAVDFWVKSPALFRELPDRVERALRAAGAS
jgi:DNA-binding NtrC family response regulator